ncbi:MAG: hypothetical protein F4039_10095 [Gammaproteobacteria bacterium]|nr:hypothetical protein [Gammaproteobacteria bacterium]
MKTNLRVKLWLGAGGIGLLALGVGVFLWLGTPRVIPPEPTTIPTTTNLSASPAPTPPAESVGDIPPAALVGSPLPPVDYPPGSVGEACGVNSYLSRVEYFDSDYKTRSGLENSPFDSNGAWKPLTDGCLTALDNQLYTTNPYLWFDSTKNRQFAFIVTDQPLTFERLFTDPVGDLLRVQEALARPECHPRDDPKSNWKLNETCHADALLNYALITRLCYGEWVSDRTRTYYWAEDNPTPEQDRSMWIQDLEEVWVHLQCESLDPALDLQSEVQTELRAQLRALYPDSPNQTLGGILIELAARLGDDAAALTRTVITSDRFYWNDGYKYGPLAGWFTNVFDPYELFTKLSPSIERLRQLVPLFGKNIGAAGGKLIKFDHEALVQHLCTPPYYDTLSDSLIAPDPPSCREIINELRQESLRPPMLEAIATFEDVAMRLEVYE